MIIGYDARHNSDVFAPDTAEIMAGAGFEVLVVPGPLPTPVVAFGIGHFGCVAGVVVTASHNPPQDNGYKVYLGDGSQIVPPADAEIAARIDEVAEHRLQRRAPGRRPIAVLGRRTRHGVPGPARLAGARPTRPASCSWVYTPLHGVGGAIVDRAIATGRFPTRRPWWPSRPHPTRTSPPSPSPIPEEPGAIDLALALAAGAGRRPGGRQRPGRRPLRRGRRRSTGAGGCCAATSSAALLGDDALRRGVRGTYACSIVSSSLLSAMAAAYGQPFVYTLTGFKWIGRVPGLAFGYEEAIGYCVDPEAVPDKDGISALIRVLTLAAELKAAGSTVADRLDEIARTLRRLRDRPAVGPGRRPQPDRRRHGPAAGAARRSNCSASRSTVVDLADGSPDLPPTDGVLITGESIKVVVRPSGTEPKLKCYLEARSPVTSADDLGERSSPDPGVTVPPPGGDVASRSACPPADRRQPATARRPPAGPARRARPATGPAVRRRRPPAARRSASRSTRVVRPIRT